MTRPELSVSEHLEGQRQRLARVVLLLIALAAAASLVAGALIARDQVAALVGLVAAAILPIVFWRVRAAPVVFVAFAATGIERFRDPAADNLLGKIPLFVSFSDSLHVSGAIVTPIELIFGLALLAWVARGIAERSLTLRSSHLGVATAILLGTALVAELIGLARGGVFNISLWELRPFVYLAISYLLASQLLDRRANLQALLWGMVIGTGLKGLLGAERTINNLSVFPRPESILEHDEAFFFSFYIVLTLALWLFGQRGWLRVVATILLPFVVLADLGNNRRTAWVVLPAILIATAVIVYTRTSRRRLVALVVGTLLAASSGYVVALHNSTSLLGSPAHAIWSQFQADPRDQNSNLYRDIENRNLGIDIRSTPVIVGEGFGVPIPHPVPVFDATQIDPLINFIPHNTVLYVWLRLGMVGAIAFWCVVGAGVVAACRLARRRDAWFGLVGTVVLAAIVAWVFEGWLDKGIVSFRITIVLGCLLGALEAARRMPEEAPVLQHVRARVRLPAVLSLRRLPGTTSLRRRSAPAVIVAGSDLPSVRGGGSQPDPPGDQLRAGV